MTTQRFVWSWLEAGGRLILVARVVGVVGGWWQLSWGCLGGALGSIGGWQEITWGLVRKLAGGWLGAGWKITGRWLGIGNIFA